MPQSISNYIVRKFYTVHIQSVCKYSICVYIYIYYIYTRVIIYIVILPCGSIQRFSKKIGGIPNSSIGEVCRSGASATFCTACETVSQAGFLRRRHGTSYQLHGERKRVLVDLNGMIYIDLAFFAWWIYRTRNLGLQ